jgi:CheY-like chemotaxis protein
MNGTATRPHTILLVDDHEALLTAMAEFLEAAGHTVRLAHTGSLACYRLFHEHRDPPVDVVVTDLRMPGIDGLDLYRIAAMREPALARRFVFVTGARMDASQIDALQGAAIPVVEKPFLFQSLASAIEQVAERPVS